MANETSRIAVKRPNDFVTPRDFDQRMGWWVLSVILPF